MKKRLASAIVLAPMMIVGVILAGADVAGAGRADPTVSATLVGHAKTNDPPLFGSEVSLLVVPWSNEPDQDQGQDAARNQAGGPLFG
jgi:hypothetical protein